jgi:hypothetical protein
MEEFTLVQQVQIQTVTTVAIPVTVVDHSMKMLGTNMDVV